MRSGVNANEEEGLFEKLRKIERIFARSTTPIIAMKTEIRSAVSALKKYILGSVAARPANLADDFWDHPDRVTREHIIWAYRLFLDRNPESDYHVNEKLKMTPPIKAAARTFV